MGTVIPLFVIADILRDIQSSIYILIFFTIGLFFLWKRRYGYAAFVGLASHLILDLNAFVPWLYPFKNYDLNENKLSFYKWFRDYLDLTHAGYELLIIVVFGIVIFVGWWLYRRYKRKVKKSTD